MSHLKRTFTLFGIIAALAAIPATAHATDNDTGPAGPGGCIVKDGDGYEIPVHDGESVFVDGKIFTCRGGTVIVTAPPSRQVDGGSATGQVATCRTRVLRKIAPARRTRLALRTANLACLRATQLARANQVTQANQVARAS
ncbi:MAG TPA: hypothetical protein VNB64_08830 [Solirubrobacteraceae bacterium]|nr:hypothetical protein [Solirubrobacteraceae bacterium]